jgi:hypothetical protein
MGFFASKMCLFVFGEGAFWGNFTPWLTLSWVLTNGQKVPEKKSLLSSMLDGGLGYNDYNDHNYSLISRGILSNNALKNLNRLNLITFNCFTARRLFWIVYCFTHTIR